MSTMYDDLADVRVDRIVIILLTVAMIYYIHRNCFAFVRMATGDGEPETGESDSDDVLCEDELEDELHDELDEQSSDLFHNTCSREDVE
jgi:hypothetical protein